MYDFLWLLDDSPCAFVGSKYNSYLHFTNDPPQWSLQRCYNTDWPRATFMGSRFRPILLQLGEARTARRRHVRISNGFHT